MLRWEKFSSLRGPYVKLIISSYKFCFLASVYCGCISFCPQCFFIKKIGKGVKHDGDAGMWSDVSDEIECSPFAPGGYMWVEWTWL